MAKPKVPLTDRAIRAVKPAPAGKRTILWDAVVPGLGLRVTDRGAKSFVLVRRYPGSPHPAIRKLGSYGAISLEAARKRARGWHAQLADGIDPRAAMAFTFQSIATDYFARKARDHRSRKWSEAVLARLVYPALGPRPIDAITRSEIVRLLDRIEDQRGPVMANRTLGIINRVMNWHASRSDTFRSPIVRGMSRGKEQSRSRILSDDELRAIWPAAEGPFGAMIKFILLTGARRNEARYGRWSEIVDSDWTIPGERYKTGIDHLIPLSKLALSVLGERSSDWLFSLNGNPVVIFRRKAAIEKASGTSGWTLHDCRRTARSLLSRAGVNADVAERCLGHVIPGVRGVYDRHEYHREKAHAFEALAALVERIVQPPADNVRQLARRAK
jgi:integrase